MLPAVGSIIEFYYPVDNQVGVRPRCRLRRVLVREVRDLVVEPLALDELISDPYLRRGRYMLTGVCMDSKTRQTFALDWNMPRECEIVHPSPTIQPIKSGPSRIERECFTDLCEQLFDHEGVTVRLCD